MHTSCSVFSIILSATTTQTLPFFVWGGMRIKRARARVPSANSSRYAEHVLKTPRTMVPVHIAEITPVRILFEQPSYIAVRTMKNNRKVSRHTVLPFVCARAIVSSVLSEHTAAYKQGPQISESTGTVGSNTANGINSRRTVICVTVWLDATQR
jgi:hypothetical protein